MVQLPSDVDTAEPDGNPRPSDVPHRGPGGAGTRQASRGRPVWGQQAGPSSLAGPEGKPRMGTHTGTLTHARTGTHTHAHTRTHGHTHARTGTHTHAHTGTHTLAHTGTDTHARTGTHTHARTGTQACTLVLAHSHTHAPSRTVTPHPPVPCRCPPVDPQASARPLVTSWRKIVAGAWWPGRVGARRVGARASSPGTT